jgi:hypothetical protein
MATEHATIRLMGLDAAAHMSAVHELPLQYQRAVAIRAADVDSELWACLLIRGVADMPIARTNVG